MRTRLILAAVLLSGLADSAVPQDENFDDKVRTLLNEGIDLYKRGKYPESYAKFEEAFQMKPGSDLVYAFYKRAGEDVVAGMMNAPDENMQRIGHRLYALARPGDPVREGKEVVLKYLKDLDSESFAVSENALWHLKNYGAWCVRFLISTLGDQNADRLRGRVIRTLVEMGADATLPVVEALDSKNAFLRQNACRILGDIKDDRALPALKRVYEDPNEPPEVKTLAHEAIQKLTRNPDSQSWMRATDYYYNLALKYYEGHSSVLHSWERYYLIWKWDAEGDRLTERRVARFAFGDQLAEEALFDLLTLDPNYVQSMTGHTAWGLLVMVHFQQATRARAGLESALQSYANDEITEEQFLRVIKELEGYSDASVGPIAEKIKAAGSIPEKQTVLFQYLDARAKVIRANVLAKIPGRLYVYEALARTLKDGNHLVAQSCLDTIRVAGRPADLPDAGIAPGAGAPIGTIGYPLIEALANEDKRVRYSAAEAMVAINPQSMKVGMELVIDNLVDALGEESVRVALVVYEVEDEHDIDFVHALRKTLIKLNCHPILVRNGSEGVLRAKSYPTEDVIILQRKIASQIYFRESHVRSPITETVFDALRDDVRTRHIPRVLLCDGKSLATANPEEELAAAKQQYDLTAQGYIQPKTHELDLKNLLEKLFDLPEGQKDAKDRADEIARSAAETLASIDPTNTLYPFRDAVEPLIRSVSPETLRRDFIRIPSARALGRYGDQRAIDVLTKVLDDKASEEEKIAQQRPLRLECARALREIFRQTGVTPTDDVFGVLKKQTKDGDYDIELAVGDAFGNASLSNEQRLDLEKFRRIERETYTADDP